MISLAETLPHVGGVVLVILFIVCSIWLNLNKISSNIKRSCISGNLSDLPASDTNTPFCQGVFSQYFYSMFDVLGTLHPLSPVNKTGTLTN